MNDQLSSDEIKNKLRDKDIFFIVDEFLGTTFTKELNDLGQFGFAYKLKSNLIEKTCWLKISDNLYEISGFIEEPYFKIHDKTYNEMKKMKKFSNIIDKMG